MIVIKAKRSVLMRPIQQVIHAITQFDTIIIHRHQRPDPDAVGSQVALKTIIQENFSDKQVFAVGYEEPSLTFLANMDHVEDDLYEDALVIVCDTANRPRIDDARFEKAKRLIKIDHHPVVDAYGDICYVDPKKSSTSEMIFDLAKEAKLNLTAEAARLLFAGIVGDTGRFVYPSTTNETMCVASELIQFDFDRTELYNQLYEVDPKIARLKGFMLDKLELNENGVTVVKLTKDILNHYDVTSEDTSALVGVYGEIRGILSWVIFVEEEDKIRVRLRSKGPKINKLAEKYNGGGHALASGATVYSWDEAEALVVDLNELVSKSNAKDI